MHVTTFNFKEFQEIIEPALLGLDAKSPTDLEIPTLDDIIEHVGEQKLDEAIEKMNKKWEEHETENNANTYCKSCKKNFIKKDGVVTREETTEPAKDTVEFHDDTPKIKKGNKD